MLENKKQFVFKDPRVVLKRYGLLPKRSFGQNFLISSRAVEEIASQAVGAEGQRVLEIGPGAGTLTSALLRRQARVTCIERDRDMCALLRAEFGHIPQFELIEADAKAFDYLSYFEKGPAVLAGNLPYQITGPLLRSIMSAGKGLFCAVIMVQEEVAKRIAAMPGDRSRGALSVMIEARFRTKIALRLAPKAFYPPPKVRSAVIVLKPKPDSFFSDNLDAEFFDAIVKAAFSTRRKYLKNALVLGGAGTIEEVAKTLEDARIDPEIRAERLTVEEFASIASILKKGR